MSLQGAIGSALGGKKITGTYYEPAEFDQSLMPDTIGAQREPTPGQPYTPDPGILGVGQADPQINWSVQQLEMLRDQSQKLFGNLQTSFEQLDEARKKLAMEKMAVAQKGQMSPDEAMKAFGLGMAAKFLGARDKYIQGAAEQYTQTRGQQFDQQYLEDTLNNQEDFRQRTAQGVANIQSIQDDITGTQAQLKSIENEIGDVYSYLKEELKQNSLDEREAVRIAGRMSLEEIKARGKMAIEQYTGEEAERARLQEYFAQNFLAQGYDMNTAQFMAFSLAAAPDLLKQAQVQGQQLDNEITEETKDFKIRLQELGVELKEEELEQLREMNPLKVEELQERIKNLKKTRENMQSIINKRKSDADAAALKLINGDPEEFAKNKQKSIEAQESVISGVNKDIAELEDSIRDIRISMGKLPEQGAEGLKSLYSKLIKEDETRLKEAKDRLAMERRNLDAIKNFDAMREKIAPKAEAPKSGANTKASTDLHTQKRNELTSRFGIRVDQHSAPRRMRGGGGTGMSRHGSGRALDVFYGNKPTEVLKALQENGAQLIIDYANQRTWRPGRGWVTDKKLDKSHKHYHVEYD